METDMTIERSNSSSVPIEMLWIDMETTGLYADMDVPLEIGIVLTDKFGNVFGKVSKLVWETGRDFRAAVVHAEENEYVDNMHTQSGLWDDLLKNQSWDRRFIDDFMVGWLMSCGVQPHAMPMSGSSIGSLDRPFAQRHFPKLNEFLSYRNVDISSIKELCRLHRPELFETMEKELGTKADATHRVIGDCFASINEYLFYLKHFLVPLAAEVTIQ
jgi:oligoribonuclease (3'-5' exoribonuclease)